MTKPHSSNVQRESVDVVLSSFYNGMGHYSMYGFPGTYTCVCVFNVVRNVN